MTQWAWLPLLEGSPCMTELSVWLPYNYPICSYLLAGLPWLYANKNTEFCLNRKDFLSFSSQAVSNNIFNLRFYNCNLYFITMRTFQDLPMIHYEITCKFLCFPDTPYKFDKDNQNWAVTPLPDEVPYSPSERQSYHSLLTSQIPAASNLPNGLYIWYSWCGLVLVV